MDSKLALIAVLCAAFVACDGRRGHVRIRIHLPEGMGAHSFHIHVNPHDTVGHLKSLIRNNIANSETHFPVYGVSAVDAGPFATPYALTYHGKVLKDNKTLAAYGIKFGSSIGMHPMN